MPHKCAVCGISSQEVKWKKLDISFHQFPSNPERRKLWKDFVGSTGKVVCSAHFSLNCYEGEGACRELVKRRRLLSDAVPTIRFPEPPLCSPPVEYDDNDVLRSEENATASNTDAPAEIKIEPLVATAHPDEIVPSIELDNEPLVEFVLDQPPVELKFAPSLDLEPDLSFEPEPWLEFDTQPPVEAKSEHPGKSEFDEAQEFDTAGEFDNAGGYETQHPVKYVFQTSSNNVRLRRTRDLLASTRRELAECRAKLAQSNREVRLAEDEVLKRDSIINDLQAKLMSVKLELEQQQQVVVEFKEKISNTLTPNQTLLIEKKRKKVRWSGEDIRRAFAIRYYSQTVYHLLRKEFNYPLPSLRSLQRWASNIDMRQGDLEAVYTILKVAAPGLTARERVVVMAYDEFHVQKDYERDLVHDEIIGPHHMMQVVMVRGLFSAWKQPVYAAFEEQMSPGKIEHIARRLHEIGYEVVGIVHDMGAGNQGVHGQVGIDYESAKTSMPHPVTAEPMYFFPDVPHLIKLFRNWLLKEGFMYKGVLITKNYLIELVKMASTLKAPDSNNPEAKDFEFNSMFKLNWKHVNVEKAEKQNVRKAVQLLSRTTAVNLRRNFGHIEEAALLAEIIETVNDWFDVMNSYKIDEQIATKKCYGLALDAQNAALDRMDKMIRELRVVKKGQAVKVYQVFQRGIMISIASMKYLFNAMISRPDLDVMFIMTYKLNQDFLENLFGMLRQQGGGHSHPTALQALNRLRNVILGKGLRERLNRNQNTMVCPFEEDFLMAKLFRSLTNQKAPNAALDDDDSEDEDEELTEPIDAASKPRVEADGFEYAMGYVARACQDKSMGEYSYKSVDDGGYVATLSHGGLTQPTQQWLEDSSRLEKSFQAIHNTGADRNEVGFRKKTNVLARTIKGLRKRCPDVSEEVIKKYAKIRTNIRVRYLRKLEFERKIQKVRLQKANAVRVRDAKLIKNETKLKHFQN